MITLYLDNLKPTNKFIIETFLDMYSFKLDEREIIRKNGKPYLKDYLAHFSISHTLDIIGCVYSNKEIGFDIEKISHIDFTIIIDKIESLYKKKAHKKVKNLEDFYNYWTSLEAYLKYKGTGFDFSTDHEFEIDLSKLITMKIDNNIFSLYSDVITKETVICVVDKRYSLEEKK
jgi:phosphopantetheinyl transferase